MNADNTADHFIIFIVRQGLSIVGLKRLITWSLRRRNLISCNKVSRSSSLLYLVTYKTYCSTSIMKIFPIVGHRKFVYSLCCYSGYQFV